MIAHNDQKGASIGADFYVKASQICSMEGEFLGLVNGGNCRSTMGVKIGRQAVKTRESQRRLKHLSVRRVSVIRDVQTDQQTFHAYNQSNKTMHKRPMRRKKSKDTRKAPH